ncbi:MAG: hypothetical protein H0W76_06165 [Pyrinomonadaceae bacterium]|nr:hypothetical protein [Pyrinomonadaceae bacterium]
MADPLLARNPPVDDEGSLQLKLSVVVNEARKLSEGLDPLVGKYELKNSESLFGLIGALILLITCLVLRPQITATLGLVALPLIVGGSVLLGIVLGIILFRGPSRWRMERNLRKLSLQLQALREEIKMLDQINDIPGEVKTQLWSAYEETIESYRQIEKFSYRASNYPLMPLSERKK